jgi:hypothetical protein
MDSARRPLRILMTNNTLASRAGSELYLRDLAVALMRRGHLPVAYSPVLGEVADELRGLTVPVIDDLRHMETAPDVIHGQHHHETMTAVLRYPGTPAVYTCHGWAPWEEFPPAFPGIMKYVAVDDLCRERLLTTAGIPPGQVSTLYNFADLERFRLVRDLPEVPRSALVFSNYAEQVSDAIRTACANCGIEKVDIAGIRSGTTIPRPEDVLSNYDIVFAKARAAIEAMASGCAVVVTDYAGLAGMVTRDKVETLRALNFGARSMQAARMTCENIEREIRRFDARDARAVTDWIRTDADMAPAVERWIALYDDAIDAWNREGAGISDAAKLKAASEYQRFLSPRVKFAFHNEHLRHKAEHERTALAEELEDLRAGHEGVAGQLAASREQVKRLEIEITGCLAVRAQLATELAACRSELSLLKSPPPGGVGRLYRRCRQWFAKK